MPLRHKKSAFDARSLHAALDQLQATYHAQESGLAPDRAEQFESHLAVLHDIVDWTDHIVTNVATQED